MQQTDQNKNPLEIAIQWADEGRKVAIATVISTWGSSSRPVGSQLVVDSTGVFEGSVSGGCVEPAVIAEAFEVIKNRRPKMLSFGVTDQEAWDIGMTCGGRIEVFLESLDSKRSIIEEMIASRRALTPSCMVTDLETGDARIFDPVNHESIKSIQGELEDAVFDAIKRGICASCEINDRKYYIHGIYPSPRLIIIGAVDIARVLAQMATLSNYSVAIIDPRGAFATKERFPDVELLVDWPDEALGNMTLHSHTAIVALTHDPKIDDVALNEALRSSAFYIGALGSRNTHAGRLDRLRSKGFKEQDLARIHGPVGLDIGAKTHAEIAVAILAEVIKSHRKGERSDIR
jgi:xanthine dehydrogenase accessory factor